MDRNTVIWMVIAAIVACAALAVLLWAARRRRDTHRLAHSEELREQLRREDVEVRHRETIAAETEARARAAQAEADAKSAEAERLHNAATSHQHEIRAARADLDQRRSHVESADGEARR